MRLGVDRQSRRLGQGDPGNPRRREKEQRRRRRRDQHDPGPARQPQPELGGDVQVGHLPRRVGDQGPAGEGLAQVRGQREGRAHPLIQVKHPVERHRGVHPARARGQRNGGRDHQPHQTGHRKWRPFRTRNCQIEELLRADRRRHHGQSDRPRPHQRGQEPLKPQPPKHSSHRFFQLTHRMSPFLTHPKFQNQCFQVPKAIITIASYERRMVSLTCKQFDRKSRDRKDVV